MSKLVVVIVNYNAGDWLLRSVKSVLSHSDADVYVVDNQSSDHSVQQTQQAFANESRLHWQLNQQNRGFAAANNQVLNLILRGNIKADYAVLLNPDCELNENTLNLIVEQFQQQPKLGLASCLIYNEDGTLQQTCRRRFPTPMSALSRMLKLYKLFPKHPELANFDYGQTPIPDADIEWLEAISGAFMVVRTTALQEVGVLDEAYFMHCEDLDWCMRFAKAHWRVGLVTGASVVHAKGVSSASRPVGVLWTLHRGMNRFFDRFYREQYTWPIRLFVKLGIYVSFIVRASKSVISGLLSGRA